MLLMFHTPEYFPECDLIDTTTASGFYSYFALKATSPLDQTMTLDLTEPAKRLMAAL